MDVYDSIALSMRRLKEVLGSLFDELYSADARHAAKGLRYGSKRHRLMIVVRDAERSLAMRSDPQRELHVVAAVELALTAELFGRWSMDPHWNEILSTLRDPGSYPHAVGTLIAAEHLRSDGRRVTLNPTRVGARSADLRVEGQGTSQLSVEVKAPKLLQLQEPDLTADTPDSLIAGFVRSAGPTQGGQLDSAESGLLVLGGFHLSRHDLKALADAVGRYFAEKGRRRTHMIGIMVVSLGILADRIAAANGVLRSLENSTITPVTTAQLTKNPFYTGSVSLDTCFSGRSAAMDAAIEIGGYR